MWTGGRIFISDPIVAKIKEENSNLSLQTKYHCHCFRLIDGLNVGCLNELSKDQSYTPILIVL